MDFRTCGELARPRQWVKNLFVLLPPLFAGDLPHFEKYPAVLGAFLSFCLLSSAVYAFNDVLDADEDRRHPEKKSRPVASGRMAGRHALLLSALLLGASSLLAWAASGQLLEILSLYAAINAAYSFKLKRAAFVDVMCIAAGFVLRMLAGAAVSSVPPSSWILLTTFFLALFLAFAKRRAELTALRGHSPQAREVLQEYTPAMLDQILTALMAMTILCYSLYTTSDYTLRRFGTESLIFTVPFVVYGLFRYFQQVQVAARGESPTEILLADRPTLVNIILWGLACSWIIYG